MDIADLFARKAELYDTLAEDIQRIIHAGKTGETIVPRKSLEDRTKLRPNIEALKEAEARKNSSEKGKHEQFVLDQIEKIEKNCRGE